MDASRGENHVFPGILVLLAFGVLGYFPHRLEEVELLSDIGRNGQHICVAYHDDWGDDFCRNRGEGLASSWYAGAPSCVAGDQRRPTRLDVTIPREIDGGTYTCFHDHGEVNLDG